MITEEIRMAVKEGAYWLDQVYPEWINAIDLGRLDLQNSYSCVLGQLMGGEYQDGFSGYHRLLTFAGSAWGHPDAGVFVREHGFDAKIVVGSGDKATYDNLTGAWVDYIEERRAG